MGTARRYSPAFSAAAFMSAANRVKLASKDGIFDAKSGKMGPPIFSFISNRDRPSLVSVMV